MVWFCHFRLHYLALIKDARRKRPIWKGTLHGCTLSLRFHVWFWTWANFSASSSGCRNWPWLMLTATGESLINRFGFKDVLECRLFWPNGILKMPLSKLICRFSKCLHCRQLMNILFLFKRWSLQRLKLFSTPICPEMVYLSMACH